MAEWVIAQTTGVDTAARWRLATSGLLPASGGLASRSGLLDNGGTVSVTGGMGVSVSAFRAFIQGGAASTQGGYLCVLDAAKPLVFEDGGASARVDIIVARVYDNTVDGSGQTKFAVEIVKGTPGAGTPATPQSAIRLATKIISAGMSAGTGGLGSAPVDSRPPRLVAAGAIVPVADATDRATLSSYNGLTVSRLDTGALEQYVNGEWVVLARPRYRCHMQRRNSKQNIPASTATRVVFDTVVRDTAGTMGTAGSGYVTIPADGDYDISAIGSLDNADNGLLMVNIAKNDTSVATLYRGRADTPSAPVVVSGSTQLQGLVAGDKVSLTVWQNVGVRSTFDGAVYGPELIVTRVS